MDATLIATETTADGKEIRIFHCAGINTSEAGIADFFKSNMQAMVDKGQIHPKFMRQISAHEMVFAKVDDAIVGMIAFKDTADKNAFMTMACVSDAFRGMKIYSMMYEQFEKLARALGYSKISSLVDVSNATMMAACEKGGYSTKFLRIEKELG